MTDHREALARAPMVIDWKLDHHLFFTWEVDIEAILPHLPPELEPVELRPGVGLFSVGILGYQEGHFRPGNPTFSEIVAVFHVHPDLSVDMPMPRFAFHALSVVSDSPDFVAHEHKNLKTPTYLSPTLRLSWSADGLGVLVEDEHGPILRYRGTHPNPSYTPIEFWGQHWNETEGLHFGIWEWDGFGFEHMDAAGDAGGHSPHPFYRGFDVRRVRGCYRQMVGKPGEIAHERFFKVRQLRA